MHYLARFLIVLGVVLVLAGIFLTFLPGISLFRLPGDIVFKKDNLTFILPLTTGLILSIILTIIINLLLRK